jgi:hypothetical protein
MISLFIAKKEEGSFSSSSKKEVLAASHLSQTALREPEVQNEATSPGNLT